MTKLADATDGADNLITTSALAAVVILAGGQSKRMGSPKALLTLPNSHERLLDYHLRHASSLQVPILIADNDRGFTATLEDEGHFFTDLADGSDSALVIRHIKDYQPTHSFDGNELRANIDSGKQLDTAGALAAIASALLTVQPPYSANSAKNDSAQQDKTSAPSDNLSLASTDQWLLVISCDSLIPAEALWHYLSFNIRDTAPAGVNQQPPNAQKQVICLADEGHCYPLLGLYHTSLAPTLSQYLDKGHRRVMGFIAPRVQTLPIPDDWQNLTNFNTPEDFTRACQRLLSYPKIP